MRMYAQFLYVELGDVEFENVELARVKFTYIDELSNVNICK